jgi:hypothetical protein
VLIAIGRDAHAVDVLHDEVRATRVRDTGVEHLRDARVLHQREHLTLGCEASENLPRVHAGLQQL